ncbi:MAG: aldolase/citrate lyase family protein [Acuticoccus sp.]
MKEIWNGGQPVLNGWLSVGHTFTAEVMAAQGYDGVTIDLQHGVVDPVMVVPMLQAMRASGVVPMVRVPWNEPGIIMRVLDAGAYGVICPMVNTADEAAAFVRSMRYPPMGERSFGPTRAALSMGDNIPYEANDEVLAFAMVETREAIDNIDAIAATPGLNGIYVGPADLTFSLHGGKYPPALDREEEEMIVVLKEVIAACHRAGIKAALHCGSSRYAARAVEWGFDLVSVASEARLMAAAAAASVGEFRTLTGTADTAAKGKVGY